MGVKTVDISQAQECLEQMAAAPANGDVIVVTKDQTPVAKIIALQNAPKKRIAGLSQGKIWMADDFDDPLPDSFWLGKE